MNWLYASIKLLSIIGAAFFAALALLTNYKDDAGRITLAGKTALCGIICTAALSITLYVLEVRAAGEAARIVRADAEAAAQRLLTPLGPMRLRIQISVPAAQFGAFHDRVIAEYSTWQQPYPMPISEGHWPRSSGDEAKAYDFFRLIMVTVSVSDTEDLKVQHFRHTPEFDKLFVFSKFGSTNLDPPKRIDLFYDHSSDVFKLETQTVYFEDFDASQHFLSFQDFSNKSLKLSFNVRGQVKFMVDFVELESRNGRRRLWIENFVAMEPDTFASVIQPEAFLN